LEINGDVKQYKSKYATGGRHSNNASCMLISTTVLKTSRRFNSKTSRKKYPKQKKAFG
jgi:hypothetical protein